MARKSKKQSGDGGNSSSFIVLFTALSTILLALFIMMNAQATREEYKVREVWGAVQSNFGVLEGGLRITPGETFYPPGPPVVMAGVEDWTESVLLTDMVGFFREETKGEGIVSYFDRDELVVSLPTQVLFEAGTARLRPRAQRVLRVISHVIRRTLNPVTVGGHADDARPPATDWDLSAARAIAVSDWIINRGRVDPGRLQAFAFGRNQPLRGKGTAPPSAANRRVSIRFKRKEDSHLTPFSGAFNFRGFLFKVRSMMGGK